MMAALFLFLKKLSLKRKVQGSGDSVGGPEKLFINFIWPQHLRRARNPSKACAHPFLFTYFSNILNVPVAYTIIVYPHVK